MKIRKKIINSVLTLMCVSMSFGCSKFLEYQEEKAKTDELMWGSIDYITQSLSAVYVNIPDGFDDVGSAFSDCSTDNAEHLDLSSTIQSFNTGTWNMFTDPMDMWDTFYEGIYYADVFITNADTCTLYYDQYYTTVREDDLLTLSRYRGEARVLKAFYYFDLFRRYGEVPIIKTRDADYEPTGDLSRRPVSEVVEYIDETVQESLEFLPTLTSLGGSSTTAYQNNLGRIFLGAAYALLSRTYLYAGSDLYAENSTMQEEYLKKCAEYSAVMFDLGYSLVSSYDNLFTPQVLDATTDFETIWDIRNSASTTLEVANIPVGFYSGGGLTNPSQDLVDAYEFKDGSTLDWNDPDLDEKIYTNRDDRFYATIVYNTCDIGQTTRVIENVDRNCVETFEGGLDASDATQNGSRTGYYLKKHINVSADLALSDQTKRHYWPVFRYAEVLLNYAEAMNELYGPSSDPEGYGKTALDAMNEVRTRAGLPASTISDKDELRELIRKERRVELAFENHRHWDVRRWKIAEETIGQPLNGVNITRSGDATNGYSYEYTKFELEDRIFEEKMYLHPLPSSEILITDGYAQNPGW